MKYTPLLLCWCCIFIQSLDAQGFLRVQDQRIVNEKGENVLLRGMGLGGWMLQEGYMLRVQGIGQQQHVIRKNLEDLVGKEKTATFYNAWLANHTRKIDIDSLAAWGFNSVRLAMHYNLYTLPVEAEPVPGQNTWLEKGFALTDSLLQWCKNNKLYLILDLHAAPGGQGNDLNIADRNPDKPSLWQSEANQQKMIALWRKLAERYANEPWLGAYDIINEPNWGFASAEDRNGCNEPLNEPLKKLMIDITKTIREVDNRHIIIVEGNCWDNNYNGIFPLWDNNMVISFHKYWNYNNLEAIQKYIDIRTQQNAPVWLGESGENSNVWFRDAIHLIENNNIGWAWWPLKKLGYNNPLEVKVPKNYQKILDFWANKGPKPSAEEAYQGLMELAENVKLENCIYHADVIDAMFRQTQTNATKPFKKHVITTNSMIHAVDYDMGRNGFAYADRDTGNYYISVNSDRNIGNRGNTYRNDGVDITRESNNPGSYYISHFETDEWLQYTVEVAKKGIYTLKCTVASENADGKLGLSFNNITAPALAIPNTKGWEQWQTVEIKGITLKKGLNIIKLSALNGGFNIKSLEFVRQKRS
ncbi:MAG: cellulase family glycosylhydrolase [Saprospiraceae bacterium]